MTAFAGASEPRRGHPEAEGRRIYMVDGRRSTANLAVSRRPQTVDARYTLQFEVNQQPYFLNFIPEKGRWILFKATRSGIETVPVVNDDEATLFPDGIEVDSDPEVVN